MIEYEFFIEDGKGKESIFSIWTADEVEWPDVQSAARGLLPALRNIITGGVVGCRASQEMDFSGLYGSFPALRIPDPDSDVEEGAILTFVNQQDDGSEWKPRFPTFDEDLIIEGTKLVDLEDPRVQALANGLIGELYVTSHEYPLEALADGKENFIHRKYKNRKRR